LGADRQGVVCSGIMRRVPNPVDAPASRRKTAGGQTSCACGHALFHCRFASPPRVTTPIEVKQFWLDWHPSSTHIIFSAYATLAMVRQNGSFRMRRPRFQRTVQNPLGMPRAAVIAATIAVAVLANGTICTAVHAQQRDPVDQRRLEAPIGHRQPRPQDLPSRAPQDENNARDVNRSFDVSPEINICRGC
jgi:hypothetical protein